MPKFFVTQDKISDNQIIIDSLLLEKRIPIGKLEIMRLLFLKGKQHLAQEFSLFVHSNDNLSRSMLG